MGFGNTAKKLQSVVDMADDLYAKIGELREQLNEIRKTIDTTNERVGAIETELDEQRALIEAIAKAEGIDVSETVAAAATDAEAETAGKKGDEAPVPDQQSEN